MLGRSVGPVAAAEGPEFLAGIRHVLSSADLAAANLESPLTRRAHLSSNPNVLQADPALAPLLAGAGFDLMSVANNHALDSGPGGLADTIEALEAAGLTAETPWPGGQPPFIEQRRALWPRGCSMNRAGETFSPVSHSRRRSCG